MSRYDEWGEKLPRGVIYDPKRRRYRVRLYRRQREIWLTYHHDRAEALKTLYHAKKKQHYVRSHEQAVRGIDDYVTALQGDLI